MPILATSPLRSRTAAALALFLAAMLLLAACGETLTRAPVPDDAALDRLAVNVGPTEQLIAALEQALTDGATPPGPYVSMINQLRTALRLAGEGKVEQGERLVMRVGERIEGLVERGQMDAGLADTLLELVDAVLTEDDTCTPSVYDGDMAVTDALLPYLSTAPYTHVIGSVSIQNLSASDVDVLPCLERVDGDITVVGNDDLVMLHGFDRLASLGGVLFVAGNASLTTLPTFPALETADGVRIRVGPSLDLIVGFNALTAITDQLRIEPESFGITATLNGFHALVSPGSPPFIIYGAITIICPSLQLLEPAFLRPACVHH